MGRKTTLRKAARDAQRAPVERAPVSRRVWLGAALLVLVVFLVGTRQLVLGQVSGIWDADSQFAPYQMLVADHARAGEFLLWNPWDNGGSPDGFEPQFGAFSPITTGLGLLSGGREWGFRLYWLFIWILGGLGMVTLGRHLGAPPWGAAVVSIAFLFSGLYTGHAQATPFLSSMAFLPWIIWRIDVAVRCRSILAAVQAGALHGLSALAGHPAFVIATSGFAALWVLGRCALSDSLPVAPAHANERRHLKWTFALSALVVFFALAFAVLSPTYLGFLIENRGFTFKTDPLTREVVTNSNVLEPGALSTFASPYLMIVKAANRDDIWPRTDLSSCSLYVGALVAVLGVLALLGSSRDKWRWWLVGAGALFLAFSLGDPVPLRGWLYDLVPLTRYFRHAAIFRVYAMFALAILALYATRDLASTAGDSGSRVWRRFPVVGVSLAVLAYVSFAWVEGMVGSAGPDIAVAHWHFWLAWLGAVAVAFVGCRAGARARLGVVPWLALAVVTGDALFAAELNRSTMYLPRERWQEIERRQSNSLDLAPHGLDRRPELVFDGMLDNKSFTLRVPVLRSYSALENSLHRQWVEDARLVDAATGPQRIWFSAAVARVAPTQEAWVAFLERVRTLGAPPLVLHTRANMLAPRDAQDLAAISSLPAAHQVPVDVETYEPNRLSFTAVCPDSGWLWVTDRWARGWRATVNGQSVEVLGGNFIFRAVPVAAGLNRIVFEYHPFGYPWLLILSWGTMMTVGLVTLWFTRRVVVAGRSSL
jgi:hypothetical protein